MKRILLKLSGEMLLGSNPMGIDPIALKNTASNLIQVKNEGYEACCCHRRRKYFSRPSLGR